MVMNEELRMWMKEVMTYFNALFSTYLERLKKIGSKAKSG
jgi:hypothetical protein